MRWKNIASSAKNITDEGNGAEKSTPSANTCSKLDRFLLLTACSSSLSRSFALAQVLLAYFFSTYFARINSHLSSLKQEKYIFPIHQHSRLILYFTSIIRKNKGKPLTLYWKDSVYETNSKLPPSPH